MRQSLRRGLAALLALVLVLGTYPAVTTAASLDGAETSAVSQEEETATQTEETTETAEGTASDSVSTEDADDADPEEIKAESPAEEDTTSSEPEAGSDETEEAEPVPAEAEETEAAEETAEDEETDESEPEVSAASTTRTVAYHRDYAKKGTTFRILVIGNSYGQDTTQYLYRVAAAAGYDVVVGNLYVGG